MKWYVLAAALVCLTFLLCAAGCTTDSSSDVIRVGVGEDFPPWSYPNENGEYIGFAVETISMIAKQNGKEVEIVPLPWPDIVDNVADGTVDVIFGGLTITPERAQIIDFTMPYVFVNKGAAVWSDSPLTLEDVLSGEYKIATLDGGTSYNWLLENVGGEIYPMPTVDAAFSELQNRNVDAVVYDEVSINRYVRSGPFKKVGTIETYGPHAGAVKKGNAELRDLINDGITALRTSPEWQQLHTKYNIPYS